MSQMERQLLVFLYVQHLLLGEKFISFDLLVLVNDEWYVKENTDRNFPTYQTKPFLLHCHSNFVLFNFYFRHVMRQKDYIIDENDVFQIKPIDSDSEEDYSAEYPACVDAIGGRQESDEDWD